MAHNRRLIFQLEIASRALLSVSESRVVRKPFQLSLSLPYWVFAILVFPFLHQSGGGAEPAAGDVDLAAAVKQIFRSRCLECHGPDRREGDLHVLQRNSLVGEGRPVYPFNVNDSLLYDYVASDDEDFRMPESPRPALSRSEIETIRKWIDSGAPEFPADVGSETSDSSEAPNSNVTSPDYVIQNITRFLEQTPREERPFLRFFSSHHLVAAGVTSAELMENRDALTKAINHLSWQPDLVQPIVVDGKTASVFAVDIRKTGWHLLPFSGTNPDAAALASATDIFDLILLEYPYGVAYESSDLFDQLRDSYLDAAQLVRPIPYLRIDWFVSTATQSPLYEDILQLPHLLAELEGELGVDSESNVQSFIARRAGMTLSGVSRNNRVVERHPAAYGAYWKSFDFQTSKGQQNMFADPIHFQYAGGEMIWSLPNGLQAYLITDAAGNRILEAPTSIVTDKFAEDKVVRNGLACMRCHDRGMKRFADNVRPAFENVADAIGLSKRDILKLYPSKSEMDQLLDRDETKFLNSMNSLTNNSGRSEPLTPVSRKFLEAPITLPQAAFELGVADIRQLQAAVQLPQFVQLGLAGLSAGQVIRRDTWEDYFDRVISNLGLGIPISPVDGNTRLAQLSDKKSAGLTIQTNKSSNVFSPGEDMFITVANSTGVDQFIELVGTSALGRKVVLTDGVISLPAGKTFRFPDSGAIRIKPQLGTELITVFANNQPFEAGILLQGDRMADRFIHNFYTLSPDSEHIVNVPNQLIKKTLQIETK